MSPLPSPNRHSRPGRPGSAPGAALRDEAQRRPPDSRRARRASDRSEEHTSELQSQSNLVCRLLLEKKKNAETTDLEDTAQIAHPPGGSDSYAIIHLLPRTRQ